MNSQEILNTLLIIGLVIITSCVLYITYYFVRALKTIINLTDNLEEAAQNIRGRLGIKALAYVPAVLIALISRFFKKRG